MFRYIAIFCLLIATVSTSEDAEAKVRRKSHRSTHYKPTKHKRKSRRYRHHGNGPDLKAITTESPYKDEPSNGVTPVETKQPGQ